MTNFDFTKEHKKNLNYLLFKFTPKLSIVAIIGLISSQYTKIDITNYKKTTFAQMFIFLAIEEYINSFVPRWKDDKKSKAKSLNPAQHFPYAKTLNPAQHFPYAKTLNPAQHTTSAKTLNPAQHTTSAKTLNPAQHTTSAKTLNPAHHEL